MTILRGGEVDSLSKPTVKWITKGRRILTPATMENSHRFHSMMLIWDNTFPFELRYKLKPNSWFKKTPVYKIRVLQQMSLVPTYFPEDTRVDYLQRLFPIKTPEALQNIHCLFTKKGNQPVVADWFEERGFPEFRNVLVPNQKTS